VFWLDFIGFKIPVILWQHNSRSDVTHFSVFYDPEMDRGFSLLIDLVFSIND
jgi:hypothetical protein